MRNKRIMYLVFRDQFEKQTGKKLTGDDESLAGFFEYIVDYYSKELKKEEKMCKIFLDSSEEVSNKIREIILECGIPSDDYWSEGIEAIKNYCLQIDKEINLLRQDLDDLKKEV